MSKAPTTGLDDMQRTLNCIFLCLLAMLDNLLMRQYANFNCHSSLGDLTIQARLNACSWLMLNVAGILFESRRGAEEMGDDSSGVQPPAKAGLGWAYCRIQRLEKEATRHILGSSSLVDGGMTISALLWSLCAWQPDSFSCFCFNALQNSDYLF